jgi:hypothetical protein
MSPHGLSQCPRHRNTGALATRQWGLSGMVGDGHQRLVITWWWRMLNVWAQRAGALPDLMKASGTVGLLAPGGSSISVLNYSFRGFVGIIARA